MGGNTEHISAEEQKLSKIETQIVDYRKVVESKEIVDIDTLNKAGDSLKTIKDFIKAIDNTRLEIIRPFNKAIKETNEKFNSKKRVAEEIRDILSGKIIAYQKEQRRIQEEEERKRREEAQKKLEEEKQKKLQEAAERNDEEKLAEAEKIEKKQEAIAERPIDIKQTTRGAGSTTTIVKVWKHEVIEPLKVPRPFLKIDDAAIKQAIKNGTREIAGVRIYQDDQLRSR